MAECVTSKTPGIIVLGGAYSSRINKGSKEFLHGIKQAARGGYDLLMQDGKTAVDAVEEAVRILENDEYFDAGVGSFLNNNGEVECDAMIMDGNTMKTGAVMAVKYFTNPVLLSRKVMEETPHCALCAEGALKFAKKIQFPICDPKELTEKTALKAIISSDDYDSFVNHHYAGFPIPEGTDSVSAIAIDANGHLACATSTGGLQGKMEGRVSDAPLVGCGGYANKYGAATSSGHGEAIMKMTLARDVVFNMEKGLDAQKSAETSVKRMQDDVEGYGGVIAIDKNGNFGKAFNTEVMIWATVKDDKLNYGMKRGECRTESIE